jgi:hypothetical protein
MVSGLGSDMAEGRVFEKDFTPFLMQTLYQMASTAITIGQGDPDRANKERIDMCKRLLQLIESRWRVTSKSDVRSFCVNIQLILSKRGLSSHFECSRGGIGLRSYMPARCKGGIGHCSHHINGNEFVDKKSVTL